MKRIVIIILSGLIIASAGLSLAVAEDVQRYTCPMHPHYVADHAGNCPVCGMSLVPIERQPTTGGASIQVDSQMLQTMGVRTAAASLRAFGREVRAFGRIVPSSRLETVVASRVEGWVEALSVTAEGDSVAAGGLLYRVYSPELIAAQRDYLAALNAGSENRAASALRRLRSLGMQNSTIAGLRQSRDLIENVPVVAEAPGIVSMLAVREGAYVKPGDNLLRLQSYSRVWVMASVAEQQLAAIAPGDEATLAFPAIPGAPASGAVDFIYPTVDATTRTGQVRIVVDNPDGKLKPGAYVDVLFSLDLRERLAVPGEAILRDSRGAHVVLALGGGRFAPRAVVTGISASGRTEILQGLEAGDVVVVSAQFLLDSETNLREGLQKLTPADSHSEHAGHMDMGTDR